MLPQLPTKLRDVANQTDAVKSLVWSGFAFYGIIGAGKTPLHIPHVPKNSAK